MESVAVLLIQDAWRGAGWCGNLVSFMGSGVGGDSWCMVVQILMFCCHR
jgi:hypothetical protein